MEQHAPITFIIFGATGDLAEKKLFPALFQLFHKGYISTGNFRVVAFARRPFSHKEFQELVRGFLSAQGIGPRTEVNAFLSSIVYHQGYFDQIEAYQGLLPVLAQIDEEFGMCSHKLFHLSLSPFFYETTLELIDRSGLNISCVDSPGKTKILLEKPLGVDSKSGKKINKLLSRIFAEDAIFRIDHYLMKNALWHLLTMHFHEAQLKDVWTSEFIDHVEIHLFEKLDIQGRGSFYDHVGALRDVGQNHMLEMLALLAMENPATPDASAFRKERRNVLLKLRLAKFSKKLPNMTRGQYEGYETEEGVETGSQTETYFSFEANIDTPRWKGVPFILSGGKALAESKVEAVVHFKSGDRIEFCIQPDPHVTFLVGGKRETLTCKEIHQGLDGWLGHGHVADNAPEGYEKVYFDALHGNQIGFVEKGEIEAAWAFVDEVRSLWKKVPLMSYPKGSEPLHFSHKMQ